MVTRQELSRWKVADLRKSLPVRHRCLWHAGSKGELHHETTRSRSGAGGDDIGDVGGTPDVPEGRAPSRPFGPRCEGASAMNSLNWLVGWSLILAGFVVGAVIGLFFHRDDFAGGYHSWRRRLLRLGHIACVALGVVNLVIAVAGQTSVWFMAGGIAMPVICFLAGWRKVCRHLFFVPVMCLVVAAGSMLWCSGGFAANNCGVSQTRLASRWSVCETKQPALHRSAATTGERP